MTIFYFLASCALFGFVLAVGLALAATPSDADDLYDGDDDDYDNPSGIAPA